MAKASLSTHVLDTSSGGPGSGMQVELFQQEREGWSLLHSATTSEAGRCANLCTAPLAPATYKLRFHVGRYYTRNNVETLYPYVEVVFQPKENQHYHIPLIISPYGYSTYRGS